MLKQAMTPQSHTDGRTDILAICKHIATTC